MPGYGRESDALRRFSVHASRDRSIAELAGTQNAVFSLDQLRARGVLARSLQRRASSARIYRIYPGVYSLVPPALLNREGRWMGAVLACGPDAILSHRSAAALHELR